MSRWFDPTWVPRAADITVRQLLQHTSGLRDYGVLPEYTEAVLSRSAPWTDDNFADRTLRQPLLFEPGTSWAYSNPGYWLLARIVEKTADKSLAEALEHWIKTPLELSETSLALGRFAEDLPHYPAEWVWHGLVQAPASECVRFMASPVVQPLRSDPFPAPVQHPQWTAPHQGRGLMIEPGRRYGHTGNGPHYDAACFHFERSGTTGCVLLQTNTEGAALTQLLTYPGTE